MLWKTASLMMLAAMPVLRVTAFQPCPSHRQAFQIGNRRLIHSTDTRLFLGFIKDIFSGPQIASQEEVIQAFKNLKTVVVDVRSPGEITTRVDSPNWVNAPGTPFSCELLETKAAQLIGPKSTPVIVYCASGKRSQKAANILTDQGYEKVYNAGGIGGLGYLPLRSNS